MYLKFVFCLSIGLVGLCMVLTTILDKLLSDWDILAELGGDGTTTLSSLDRPARRLEDEVEARPAGLATRLDPYARR